MSDKRAKETSNPKDWKKFKDEYVLEEENDDMAVQEASEDVAVESLSLENPSYRELEEKLTYAEQQAHENWEKSVRAAAEIDNIRRRSERDIANAHRYSLEKFTHDLLPVIDSLEQAIQVLPAQADAHLRDGLELTMKLFCNVLEKYNVEQLNPEGCPFNPQQHEAMSIQPSIDVAPNTVLAVFQKGYKLHDRVIRPARVVVSKEET